MRFLLDENIPLRFHKRLAEEGYQAEHIILLGQRGMADSHIRNRLLAEEDLVLFTHDTDFEWIKDEPKGVVILSRVRQQIPVPQRIEIWMTAITRFSVERPVDRFFELIETGELNPIHIVR